MKIIMGADPAGFELKNAIKEDLLKRGYDVTDIDPDTPVLFQDAAKAVARGVQSKEYERGIAICGTGMGVSIICNKHRGVYAALCESIYQARRAKVVNQHQRTLHGRIHYRQRNGKRNGESLAGSRAYGRSGPGNGGDCRKRI